MTESLAERTFSVQKPNANAQQSVRKAMPGKLALVAAMLSLVLIGGPGYANESDEVQKLIQRGQLEQALSRTEAFLATRPNDPQMRFLKALILTERNRTNEAIAVFTKLTEDFPELPEPYNNLAVLYAGRGEFDKARDALEMAIRTHPSYATAHENLGDIYAKMASQSYDKALQLDTRNQTAQTKLALVRNLVGTKSSPNSSTTQATPPSASPTPVGQQPNQQPNQNTTISNQVANKPQTIAKATQVPIPPTPAASGVIAAITPPQPLLPPIIANTPPPPQKTPSVVKREKADEASREISQELPREPLSNNRGNPNNNSSISSKTNATNAPVVSHAPAVIRPNTVSTPYTTNTTPLPKSNTPNAPTRTTTLGNDTQVLDTVQRWAKAWASQDIATYLDVYSKNFTPPNNMTRSNWEKQREERIVGKGSIRVIVENPQISIAGNQAVVKFKQRYYADRLTNISIKILNMQLENGVWRIVNERVEG